LIKLKFVALNYTHGSNVHSWI